MSRKQKHVKAFLSSNAQDFIEEFGIGGQGGKVQDS